MRVTSKKKSYIATARSYGLWRFFVPPFFLPPFFLYPHFFVPPFLYPPFFVPPFFCTPPFLYPPFFCTPFVPPFLYPPHRRDSPAMRSCSIDGAKYYGHCSFNLTFLFESKFILLSHIFSNKRTECEPSKVVAAKGRVAVAKSTKSK